MSLPVILTQGAGGRGPCYPANKLSHGYILIEVSYSNIIEGLPVTGLKPWNHQDDGHGRIHTREIYQAARMMWMHDIIRLVPLIG